MQLWIYSFIECVGNIGEGGSLGLRGFAVVKLELSLSSHAKRCSYMLMSRDTETAECQHEIRKQGRNAEKLGPARLEEREKESLS